MALPRPTLLAIAGVLLSLMSFTAMRTIATETGGDLPTADVATQSVAAKAPAPKPDARGAKPDARGAKPDARGAKPPPPPEPKVQDVPRPVSKALADGKLVVLLFADKNAADDVATSRQFGALSQLGGKVRSFRTSLSNVGRYRGIVADLGITQAPSIVIVRPDLRALPPLEGYVDSQYLLQRVRDQLK